MDQDAIEGMLMVEYERWLSCKTEKALLEIISNKPRVALIDFIVERDNTGINDPDFEDRRRELLI